MPTEGRSCKIREIKAVDIDRYEGIAKILNIMSNKTRVAILDAIVNYEELCACELQPALQIPQPTITTHLRKMYDIGLLERREAWKYSYYSVNPEYEQLVNDLLKSHSGTRQPVKNTYSKNQG